MDLSNKSLALLLLAAIVISIGGTMISLNRLSQLQAPGGDLGITGQATGETRINITSEVGCNVDTNVDFGTNSSQDITLSSDSANTGTGFNDCSDGAGTNNCKGMEINNTGNVNVNTTLRTDQQGAAFLGGPDAQDSDFKYEMRNGTFDTSQPGCVNNSGISSWTGLQTVPGTDTAICNNFTFDNANDMMTVEYNLTLHTSTTSGQKTATITVLCNQI